MAQHGENTMNRPCLLRCGWPTLTALLLILLVPGCKDDNPVAPKPKPSREMSMSLGCNNGLIDLTVRNSGWPMSEPSLFVAAFEDGQSDTLLLSVDTDDSTTCQLSNVHGGVTVSNEEWNLEATTGDCLADYFESLVTSVDLADFVPSPLMQQTVVLCVYTVYLRNFDYDHATFQLIRTDDGLTLQFVYSDITGNLAAQSPGWLCPDLTGNIAISSIVVETHIDIGEGDDPQVTLGDTQASVNGLQVNVNGTFGFIVTWITSWFQSYFTVAMEDAIAAAIGMSVPTDLSGLVIVHSSCAE
jgi:hypothetical protein